LLSSSSPLKDGDEHRLFRPKREDNRYLAPIRVEPFDPVFPSASLKYPSLAPSQSHRIGKP
jgi:hypothetical protein